VLPGDPSFAPDRPQRRLSVGHRRRWAAHRCAAAVCRHPWTARRRSTSARRRRIVGHSG